MTKKQEVQKLAEWAKSIEDPKNAKEKEQLIGPSEETVNKLLEDAAEKLGCKYEKA